MGDLLDSVTWILSDGHSILRHEKTGLEIKFRGAGIDNIMRAADKLRAKVVLAQPPRAPLRPDATGERE